MNVYDFNNNGSGTYTTEGIKIIKILTMMMMLMMFC